MEGILPYIVQLVLGAIGGIGTAQVVKRVDLGMAGNVIAGAIGGVVGVWLAAYIPGLAGFVGAGAAAMGTTEWIGQVVVGFIGGGILTAIAGGVKGMMGNN